MTVRIHKILHQIKKRALALTKKTCFRKPSKKKRHLKFISESHGKTTIHPAHLHLKTSKTGWFQLIFPGVAASSGNHMEPPCELRPRKLVNRKHVVKSGGWNGPGKNLSLGSWTLDISISKIEERLDLVGGWATPLKNMSSSIGMMTFPSHMGK